MQKKSGDENDLVIQADKSLGQHFLFDQEILRKIVSYADLSTYDVVLEIGPGLGTLTAEILKTGAKVTAVEFDRELANNLPSSLTDNPRRRIESKSCLDSRGDEGLSSEDLFGQSSNQNGRLDSPNESTNDELTLTCHSEFISESNKKEVAKSDTIFNWIPDQVRNDEAGEFKKNLQIINADFLQFDLNTLPKNYKVVANVPYYITAKIVQKLLIAKNKPSIIVLLVQKEVAERLAAKPGEMSVLSISAQLFAEVSLGIEVPARFFTPPPKVDSQVVILRLRTSSFAGLSGESSHVIDSPIKSANDKWDWIPDQVRNYSASQKLFFRLVKAGFSARRKKLRSSLAGGLNISKLDAENLLQKANINPNLRAQDLSLEDWSNLSKVYDESY